MARRGLSALGIDDPGESRNLVVYVECDRCLTDAIGTVTGCKLGRRSLKWMDYGKSAATFLNTDTGEAVRLNTKQFYSPPEDIDLVKFFEAIPDDEMFNATRVKVDYRQVDLPGKPLERATCQACNEVVNDGRQITQGAQVLCKACANGAYYDLYEEEMSNA